MPGSGKDWDYLEERQSLWKVMGVASSTRQEERLWAEWWWGDRISKTGSVGHGVRFIVGHGTVQALGAI